MKLLIDPTFFLRWKGGENYLLNLLKALHLCGVSVVLEGTHLQPDAFPQLKKHTFRYPKRGSFSHIKSKFFKQKTWFGLNQWLIDVDAGLQISDPILQSLIPVARWIPDFQHIDMPEFFSTEEIQKRNAEFSHFSETASKIIVSSEHAKSVFDEQFASAKHKSVAVPFAVDLPQEIWDVEKSELQSKYGLPDRWIHFPSQWWKHKNHQNFLSAFEKANIDVGLVISGKMEDYRNVWHRDEILGMISHSRAKTRIYNVGEIPYYEMLGLLRYSVGFVNPSFYEGWSTTVEEAKTLQKPILVSNIAVHREQLLSYAHPKKECNPNSIKDIVEGLEWLTNQESDVYTKDKLEKNITENLKSFGNKFLLAVKLM